MKVKELYTKLLDRGKYILALDVAEKEGIGSFDDRKHIAKKACDKELEQGYIMHAFHLTQQYDL